jgi:hypothetical protein
VNKKVTRIIQEVETAVAQWPGVDCLMVMENENDHNDPYFFLSFDVHCLNRMPAAELRQASLARAGAWETNKAGLKDRFLLDDVPVRLEYKAIGSFADLAESGTYALHRLVHGRVLFSRSAWLEDTRRQIVALDADFWDRRRFDAQSQMEHHLVDMEAARIRNDRLFYTLSLAGFINKLSSTLFAINRSLEPNHRLISRELLKLPVLPETFNGSLDILLRFGELPLERHCEIAVLLTRKITAL